MLCTPVLLSVPEMEGMSIIYIYIGVILFLRMYLWWGLCTLYLLAFQVRVPIGDSGLCCCIHGINFLCFLILHKHFRTRCVSNYLFIYSILF